MNKKKDNIPGNQPLNMKIKPKNTVHLGDLKGDFNSGCSVIDVGFPNVFYVEVTFFHCRSRWKSLQCLHLLLLKGNINIHSMQRIKNRRIAHESWFAAGP